MVVVHPPFRWQRDYARGFVAGVRRLTESTGITFCVENMYPWRTPGGELKAYMPGWDPTELDYDHLTLDFSHASTANQQSLDLARRWGTRLRHVHLTDGTGSVKDEHLVPGRGDQHADGCWSTSPSRISTATWCSRSTPARARPGPTAKIISPSRWRSPGCTWPRPMQPSYAVDSQRGRVESVVPRPRRRDRGSGRRSKIGSKLGRDDQEGAAGAGAT